ncbi:MAG: DNA polymerase I [Coriobacteriales bacterium]|jgi:DNA polymerase-1|nr:DNA polymerase I [Coriobacteriales bacterium]
MDERVIAIIDGNSLMHRAFHAVQTPMNAPDGRPTNACFGFISMLLKLVGDFKPSGIIAAFDAGIPQQRFEAIEQYKAQRPPTDPALKLQFPMIEALLTSLSIPVMRVQDYEGDDIIGTLSTLAEEHGGIRTLLITGDKDALQLASDTTVIVTNKTGMSDVRIYDPAGVYERFGVDPAHVPDYLGLMGDSSDNIPGIPGVGPKTATRLLQEYGSIEGVIAHVGELKGKLAEKVAVGGELALASRQVATIIRDVPLTVDFDAVAFPSFDSSAVRQAFGELGMMSQLRKLLKLTGDDAAVDGADTLADYPGETVGRTGASAASLSSSSVEAAASATTAVVSPQHFFSDASPAFDPERQAAFQRSMQRIIEGSAARDAVQQLLASPESVGLYVESPATGAVAQPKKAQQSLMLDDAPEEATLLYIATEESVIVLSGDDALQTLKALLLGTASVATLNLKEALRALGFSDTSETALLTDKELLGIRAFDLSVASYLLDSDKPLDDPLSLMERYLPGIDPEEYLGEAADDTGEPSRFSAGIAAAARALAPALQTELEGAGASRCFAQIEQPLTPVLAQVERTGVRVDTAVLAEQGSALAGRIEHLRQQAQELAGMEFNLDSPKQVGEVLFDKLMLPTGKKTKQGYSTNASTLTELKPLSPMPGIILEYRELAKLRSTYIDALPRLVAADGLIHTTFNQTVAATGRLSSSDPNLQNIPVRSDIGKRIRTAFVADADALGVEQAVFVSADYSQIELRLLAHLSEDEHLIAAFKSGEDFHNETAAHVFGVAPGEVTAEMRSRAKAVNFGIVYGQQAFGLSQSLNISYVEAGEMITRYFAAYPQARDYLESLKAQAHEKGWVATIFGRRRYTREITSRNPSRRSFAERTAMNHPLQGSAADIIKLAMNRVAERLQADGFRSRMVLQVHDELDFNCDASELEQLKKMVVDVMQDVVELKVPLIADVSSGPNWAEAH